MIPYIGITDFTNPDQVSRMKRVFNEHTSRASLVRFLHIGVMTSWKILNGVPSRWSKAFPPKETIADIFCAVNAFNCLHYADYDGHPDLATSIAEAIRLGGDRIHAIQLDMIWPEPANIMHGVRLSRKGVQVILQIGRRALDAVGNNPDQLVLMLRDYSRSMAIDRVLLDKSGGEGRGMDAQELLPFARAIKENFPRLGLGAAGGLGPTSMHLVEPLVKEFPDLSIDAQGQLRPSGDALTEPIDWNMAEQYLIEAIKTFNK